jgi:CheY-like chemotaxis protein
VPHYVDIDEPILAELLCRFPSARLVQVRENPLEFLKQLNDCDVVLSDIRMPGRTGIELLGQIRELRPDTPVVLMTAFGSIDSAVEAMHAGAFDYVTQPFQLDGEPVVPAGPVPYRIGEHTRSVLTDWLGYSQEQVTGLISQGVVEQA